MFLKSTDHKKYYDKDLVYLAELMLRWPFECYLKICHELFSKSLKIFVVTETYTSPNGEQINIIIEYNPSYITFDYIMKYFNIIAFKKKNVVSIERKREEYTYLPSSDLVRTPFQLCTMENINKLAAQLSYAICLTAHDRYYSDFNPVNVSSAIHEKEPNKKIYSGSKNKADWEIPSNILWSNNRSIPQRLSRQAKDLTQVKEFITKKREQGITEAKQLARLIDSFFPGLLTDQELGELLPARPQRNIKYESQRKRGQRLRKVT
ncbi:hypothetical protein [Oceanidesulfovibrio marinus]|uniref:Uncharacterized protein n=1 Tax=Oceanidesulfovibrio marinus TaxID=370038 RepID=A0A6P1ZA95_9BACT|nr:hypothetical protein [Oceanidesulfovibrio marinus]TVM30533.1 hypothetical protein DQK91_20735 [Oceanidesulfovibrio marinus]